MSFILDALRRSERARRVLGAAAPAPDPHPTPAPRQAWIVALLALLAANAALLAWFVLRTPDQPGVAPAAAPSGEVRSLAREAGNAATPAPEPMVEPDPASAPPADAAPAATPLAELEPGLQARAAALHLDAHGYAADPAQRFVIIDLKRRVVGDQLAGGARLVEIVPDGAVVEIEGRRVLLPRQ